MKIALVINRTVPLPVQINAASHMCVGLHALAGRSELQLRTFIDASGLRVATLSDYPLIVFSARNSEHLKEAHRAASEQGVSCNAFFTCMRTADPGEQEEHVRERSVFDQDYIGITLVGPPEMIKPLTRRFSLYRDPAEGTANPKLGAQASPDCV